MNFTLRIPLNASPEQVQRLLALQLGFAKVCNALAPLVQQTGVWNRVALHHLAYRQLREQFPEMGSQMVCNAIYSVSRTARLVFQSPTSPFNLALLGDRGLPLLRFSDGCPVYFDRHTLSLKQGQLSMFTLDGRMRFQLALGAQDEERFHQHKLREIVLSRSAGGQYELAFLLADLSGAPGASAALPAVSAAPQATTPARAPVPVQAGAGKAAVQAGAGAHFHAGANTGADANADTDAGAGAGAGAEQGEIPSYILVEETQVP